MRGRIIQYNGADGCGTIVVDGRQHHFALGAWRGDSAPTVNRTVEVTLDHDAVATVAAVGDDVLLKEKAAELGGKLGTLLHKIPASMPARASTSRSAPPATEPAAGGAAPAGSIVERYGKMILVAYLLFVLGTLAFNAVSVSMLGQGMGKSLFDISSALSQFGGAGGGGIKALLLLGYASIAVPCYGATDAPGLRCCCRCWPCCGRSSPSRTPSVPRAKPSRAACPISSASASASTCR